MTNFCREAGSVVEAARASAHLVRQALRRARRPGHLPAAGAEPAAGGLPWADAGLRGAPASLGLPLAIAIGGVPERCPLAHSTATLYSVGHDPAAPSSASTRTASSPTPATGGRRLLPLCIVVMNKIGRESVAGRPSRASNFEANAHAAGPTSWGVSEEIVEKILFQHAIRPSTAAPTWRRHHRARQGHACRRLLGTQVAPVVRREIAQRTAAA